MELDSKIMEKAATLIEALPYIQRFNRKIIVVKYGGSAMADEELKRNVIKDVVLLKLVGFKPIIVHGGGKEISRWVNKVGMEARFVNGLRVTDAPTMEIAFSFVLNDFCCFFKSSHRHRVSALSRLLIHAVKSEYNRMSFTLLQVVLYLLIQFIIFPFVDRFLFCMSIDHQFQHMNVDVFHHNIYRFFYLLRSRTNFFQIFLKILV